MATPTLDVRINFDRLGLNRIDNDGFETDASGWSVAAGIQGAGTSITRTSGSAYMGGYVGRLVTPATSGSGVKYVMTSVFSDTHRYRFRVWLKRSSGTTSALIRLGSLAQPTQRATQAITLTTSWAAYEVDLAVTADFSDGQVNVVTNTGSALTVDIDAAEVYEAVDDVTLDVVGFTADVGANFEGGLAVSQATITLRATPYAPGGLGPVVYGWAGVNRYGTTGQTTLVRGNDVFVRATYAGVPYGLFHGRVERTSIDVAGGTVTAMCNSVVPTSSTTVSIAASATRSIAAFRGLILDALGVSAARRTLSLNDVEADIPLTGADDRDALSLLDSVDDSTDTLGWLAYDPSTSVLYRYTTRTDLDLLARAVDVTVPDEHTGATLEFLPDDYVTDQHVDFSQRIPTAGVVWTAETLPVNLAAGASRTIWASYSDPVTSPALASTSTGSPTITPTYFDRSAKIVITAGGAASVTELSISGTSWAAVGDSATATRAGSYGTRIGPTIAAEYIRSPAIAQGLAERTVDRMWGVYPRADLTVTNLFPASLTTIALGNKVRSTLALYADASYLEGIVDRLAWTVSEGGARWDLTYSLTPRTSTDYPVIYGLDAFELDLDLLQH